MTSARSAGLWTLAWRRLLRDRVAVFSLSVVGLFLLITIGSMFGLLASDWNNEVGISYARPGYSTVLKADTSEKVSRRETAPELNAPHSTLDPYTLLPALGLGDVRVTDALATDMAEILADSTIAEPPARRERLLMGGDKWGRDILAKLIKGSETSILVGLAAAIVATLIGTITGAVAGYFGGWLDDLLNWFYSIFTAVPYLLLILAIAAVLGQKGISTIILILGLTGWTGIFRLVRAEYMKHRQREYVQAADAIGASHLRRMFVHIFPNVSHIALVQLSVNTVGFIKSEVILSFLGFGVPVDQVSWGSMLGEAQNELILGYWWQLAATTIAMAVLVTAFSLFTDALRDALDPKIKSIH